MYMIAEVSQYVAVASFSEAWIEIFAIFYLKCPNSVASFSEAWIEIIFKTLWHFSFSVASFSEAWIEITNTLCKSQ